MTQKIINAEKLDAIFLNNKVWNIAWTYVKTVANTVREPLLILDEHLNVLTVNDTFYKVFKTNPSETEKRSVYNIAGGKWCSPSLKKLLEEILPKNTFFRDFSVDFVFPKVGRKILLFNARRIYGITSDSLPSLILLAIEDTTIAKLGEEKIKKYNQNLETEVNKRTTQLEDRVKELEELTRLMIGRELKMSELKKEIARLKKLKENNSKA